MESPTRCPYDNEGRSASAVASRPERGSSTPDWVTALGCRFGSPVVAQTLLRLSLRRLFVGMSASTDPLVQLELGNNVDCASPPSCSRLAMRCEHER